MDDACVAAARDAADLLASLGHEVEEAAPDWGGSGLMDDFRPVWQIAPALYPIRDPSVLTPLNQAFLEGALETPSGAYAAAVSRLQLRARRIASLWSSYDLLLTPTLALPPAPVGWESEPDDPWEQFDRAAQFTPFTAAFNVTGQPAMSVPLHWSAEGLPIGVQLVGAAARRRAAPPRRRRSSKPARPWAQSRAPPHSYDAQKKDVRDGDTAPRTPLWDGDLQTAALPQVTVGRR